MAALVYGLSALAIFGMIAYVYCWFIGLGLHIINTLLKECIKKMPEGSLTIIMIVIHKAFVVAVWLFVIIHIIFVLALINGFYPF